MLCSTYLPSNRLLSSRSVFPCIPFHSTPIPLHPFPVSLVRHPSYPFLCPSYVDSLISLFRNSPIPTFAHFHIPTLSHSSISTYIPYPYIRSTILFIRSHIYINSSSSLSTYPYFPIPIFPPVPIFPQSLYSPNFCITHSPIPSVPHSFITKFSHSFIPSFPTLVPPTLPYISLFTNTNLHSLNPPHPYILQPSIPILQSLQSLISPSLTSLNPQFLNSITATCLFPRTFTSSFLHPKPNIPSLHPWISPLTTFPQPSSFPPYHYCMRAPLSASAIFQKNLTFYSTLWWNPRPGCTFGIWKPPRVVGLYF